MVADVWTDRFGAGPPCQGVSCLFTHVKRLRTLVQKHFPWAQVHTLMESVASMDEVDKDIMSQSFGDVPCMCAMPGH